MTLRTRNRIFLIFFIVSLIFTLLIAGGTLYLSLTDSIHNFPEGFHDDVHRYFPYSSKSTVIAVILFLIYVPTFTALVCFGFEKTPSDEMTFFLVFLVCTFFEGTRIFYPTQNLTILLLKRFSIIYPATGVPFTSMILVFITKFVVAARSMVMLSLLCMALFPVVKKYMTVVELLVLSAGISITISVVCRIKINDYQSCFIHTMAGNSSLIWGTGFVMLTTFLLDGGFLMTGTKKRIQESFGYLEMINGYIILSHADTVFTTVLAAALLFTGTSVYLRELHARLNS